MARCTGTTAAGTRCRANAADGAETCAKHADGAAPPGRPSKLTRETADAIAAWIRRPTPPTIAAMRSGISRTTYHRWMAESESPEASEDLRYFRDQHDQALADAADTLLKPVREKLFDGSSEQAKYLLGHMFPDEFGNRQRHEVSGPDGGPVDVRDSTPTINVVSLQFDATLDNATREALEGGDAA